MSTDNIDLYEVLKRLGVDPSRAQAASISSNEPAWREFDSRLRELAADGPTLQAAWPRADGLDTRLRAVEIDVAKLKWMTGASPAGITAVLVAAVGLLVKAYT